jgi:DNA-binding CsgD family transcriptional regulator
MEKRPMLLLITPLERQALGLLAHKGTEEQVAACLGICTSEVGSCLKSLFFKMGVSNQSEAIAVASRRGLLEPTRSNDSTRGVGGNAREESLLVGGAARPS